jgi:hypothetical protein
VVRWLTRYALLLREAEVESSRDPHDPIGIKAQVGAERPHAQTRSARAATGAPAIGRLHKQAARAAARIMTSAFAESARADQPEGDADAAYGRWARPFR